MKKIQLLIVLIWYHGFSQAQSTASIKELRKTFKTYPFTDPNPVPTKSLIYPYFKFDGFTNKPTEKQWKVIELENPFIKLMVLPEIGGKIWSASEKSTGEPFIYNNQVVKFRDIAMRGPWTSGGIEPNYGIIGHTPNCATPVDYKTEKNTDGSVSCYIGTFDKLTQTYWSIEINLPADKAYFTTRSTWYNGNAFEQPYYSWMNVGIPSSKGLEFIYPGSHFIGHAGEYAHWPVNAETGKNISLYDQNDFGTYKSYHVLGSYTDFFGAFYHTKNFGMGHYSLYDEKPGKKIWIWGLSRQGMIWENLLTDTDGQYVEVQSGRLFNQSAEGSMRTPFKNRGFAPYATDEWTEYWFPVKGTAGFVKANPYGSLNLLVEAGYLKWYFSPLQKTDASVVIIDEGKKVVDRKVSFNPLQLYKDSLKWTGDLKNITWSMDGRFFYQADATAENLARPLALPSDFNWQSPYALFTLGKEAAQGRDYAKAEIKFLDCLQKDPYYAPALTEMAFLQLRKMDYESARKSASTALSIDTYDPAANFAYGLANVAINSIADAKDAFGIASASVEFKAAAYTELAKLYFRQAQLNLSLDYAQKAIGANPKNLDAWQLTAVIYRQNGEKEKANRTLEQIRAINPLSHFAEAEFFLSANSSAYVGQAITQEMKEEVFLDLANWYQNLNRYSDAIAILKQAPQQAEVLYWQAYLLTLAHDSSAKEMLSHADQATVAFVFPYRTAAAKVMEWSIQNSPSWKPKYLMALIQWNAGNLELAKKLFLQCGDPNFAPFHAAKAALIESGAEQSLIRAIQLDKQEWRYGKLLASYYMSVGNNQKALVTVLDYQKQFPENDAINFLTAKCLLLNAKYKASYALLTSKNFLPSEGATEAHQLYRESLLMTALDEMNASKYPNALKTIEKALQWPENLGSGKPYDSEIDNRYEKFLQAICLEKMNKKAEANKLYVSLTSERAKTENPYLLVNALSFKKTGAPQHGLALLQLWKNRSSEKSLPDWCINYFETGTIKEPPVRNDEIRLLTRLSGLLN